MNWNFPAIKCIILYQEIENDETPEYRRTL